jgi:hypothetical protein
MDAKFWLNVASALTAFTAATLWLVASVVKKAGKAIPPQVIMGSGDIDNGTLLAATMRLQGRWNSAAAAAAACASMLQGVAMLL